MLAWIKARLDRDARYAAKLWSVRVALFWAAFAGFWVAFPAFQSYIPPVPFALCCMAISLIICIARLTHQPGLDQ